MIFWRKLIKDYFIKNIQNNCFIEKFVKNLIMIIKQNNIKLIILVYFTFNILSCNSAVENPNNNEENVKVESNTSVSKENIEDSISLKFGQFIELKDKNIDFNSPFFKKYFIHKKDTIIDSHLNLNTLNIDDMKESPFPEILYMDKIPIVLPLFHYKYKNINIVIIAYGIMGAPAFTNLLITYSGDGDLIDFRKIDFFIYGKTTGIGTAYFESNFYKKFGSQGYSEIKVNDNIITTNHSQLTVYTDSKTEEITTHNWQYSIDDNGYIKRSIINFSNFYYYKDGVIDSSRDNIIKKLQSDL